jgi:hypothetical protein
MLFRETVDIYCENHKKHIHSVGRIQNFIMLKAGGAYSDHGDKEG